MFIKTQSLQNKFHSNVVYDVSFPCTKLTLLNRNYLSYIMFMNCVYMYVPSCGMFLLNLFKHE